MGVQNNEKQAAIRSLILYFNYLTLPKLVTRIKQKCKYLTVGFLIPLR